jgi:hypothetical protein
LNLIRISQRHPEVFIGESAGSKSSKSWISSTDRVIATSKSGHDRSVCILRFDEFGDQWELIMFSSARPQG